MKVRLHKLTEIPSICALQLYSKIFIGNENGCNFSQKILQSKDNCHILILRNGTLTFNYVRKC